LLIRNYLFYELALLNNFAFGTDLIIYVQFFT